MENCQDDDMRMISKMWPTLDLSSQMQELSELLSEIKRFCGYKPQKRLILTKICGILSPCGGGYYDQQTYLCE